MSSTPVFGFAGWSGAGKTTLVEQLIPRIVATGRRVALIKHAHHAFDIDTPGKDSWRHRKAGAAEVLVTSANRWALMHELRGAPEPSLEEHLSRFVGCDLVLVEGFKTAALPKLEVHRPSVGKPLLCPDDPHIIALATDTEPSGAVPKQVLRYALDDLDGLVALILKYSRPPGHAPVVARSPDLSLVCSHLEHNVPRTHPMPSPARPPMLDFDAALSQLLAAAQPVSEVEDRSLGEVTGRVLAEPCLAPFNQPAQPLSAMDGYAVASASLAAAHAGAPVALPVSQRIPAGHPGTVLEPGTVARIFTGAPLPTGADAVVMQEEVVLNAQSGVASFTSPVQTGTWVRPVGEDLQIGAVVLAAGMRLTPPALALAASIGLATLRVRRRLRVACFFTGDELRMPGEPLLPGQIYNSNRFLLRSLLERLGCEVLDLGIVADTLEATRGALREAAARADLVLTTGGVSVGEEDHVRPAVQAEGQLELWQIAMKPGKPLAFGRIHRPEGGDAHFIGLPGNPVSSLVTFLMLVRPFILALQGVAEVHPPALEMVAAFDWPRPDRRREFLRVRVRRADGHLECFPNQGSGVLTSTAWADGLVDNPAGATIRSGDRVRYLPLAALLG